jgi:integrase
MKGHVQRRGQTFRYLFDIDPDPLTGDRRQATKGGFKTETEAWTACRAAIADYENGQRVDPSRRTVEEFLVKEWLPAVEPTLKASVHAQYEDYIRAYIVPVLGPVTLQDVSARQLAALYAHLIGKGRVRQRAGAAKGLAPKTVRNVHGLLRKAFADAVAWQYVPRNVAADVRPPRVRRRRPTVWTAEQLRRFLAAGNEDRFYGLYLLAATTGMRRGELCGLRWDQVDLDRAVLRVVDNRPVVRGHAVDGDPKTDDSARTLALDSTTVAALRATLATQEEERGQFGSGYRNTEGRVFTWEDGRPVHPDVIRQRFTRQVRALGLPLIRLYDVRHTYATVALDSGVNPKVVSERLGHSSVAFTLQVYSHVRPRHDRDAADTLAGLILGTPTPTDDATPDSASDSPEDGAA